MSGTGSPRRGMQVYGSDEQRIGMIEEVRGDGFLVEGQHIPADAVARVTPERVYLQRPAAQFLAREAVAGRARQDDDELVVTVGEERLSVGKSEGEVGELLIRKLVVEERQAVPVALLREEVHVQQRDIADRPIGEAEATALFAGGAIRIPVRGEEAVIEKQAVVTGEVVIDKSRSVQRRTLTETVRREVVEVEEHYRNARGDFERHFAERQATTAPATAAQQRRRTFEEAEPNYRTGFMAARDERYAGREFEEVEPDLRETRRRSAGAHDDDNWEHLREEIREGWRRSRARAQ